MLAPWISSRITPRYSHTFLSDIHRFQCLTSRPAIGGQEGAKHDCVTRLDRDRAAGVNHARSSRLRCRDKKPAVPMAYLCRGNQMKAARKSALKSAGFFAP